MALDKNVMSAPVQAPRECQGVDMLMTVVAPGLGSYPEWREPVRSITDI